MALSRISDLTTGTVPMIGTSLLEVSVPNAGAPSGYDSRKFTLTNILSTVVLKAGDTMTGGLIVNGSIAQGVANPNASFQGIASIRSAYNEIAAYGAGAGATAKYCAMGADATSGYLYTSADVPLHIQSQGSAGLYFDTGSPSATRMYVDPTGNTTIYGGLAVYKPGGSTFFTIYDDGNSHIESTTQLWINSNGKALVAGGASTFKNTLTVQFPDNASFQMFVAGTTRAVRTLTTSVSAYIEGVTPNNAAYSPLIIGGSTLTFTTGGTNRMSIDATGYTNFYERIVIQSQINQLWIRSLNSSTTAALVSECVGVRIYTMGVGPNGDWTVYDNSANRLSFTVTTLGDIIANRDVTASNTVYANNWVYAYGGVRCRNNANTTFLDMFDDGNSHIRSSTQLWINSLGTPTVVGGTLTTRFIVSSVAGQATSNVNTAGSINLLLDETGQASGNGGSIVFSAAGTAWKFAAIKGYVTNAVANTVGDLFISTRRDPNDGTLTATALFTNGGLCYNAQGTWYVFSDRSLKQDVEPYERGLDAIVKLSPVQFRYQPGTLFATEDAPSQLLHGLIADEVLPHIPEACGSMDLALDDDIDGEKKTLATLNPTDLIYCLINAVKELNAEIESIKSSLH